MGIQTANRWHAIPRPSITPRTGQAVPFGLAWTPTETRLTTKVRPKRGAGTVVLATVARVPRVSGRLTGASESRRPGSGESRKSDASAQVPVVAAYLCQRQVRSLINPIDRNGSQRWPELTRPPHQPAGNHGRSLHGKESKRRHRDHHDAGENHEKSGSHGSSSGR